MYSDEMLVMCSRRRTFDEGKVDKEDYWKHKNRFYLKWFQMHNINAMYSASEDMGDYVKVWRVVLLNELFHELYNLSRL